MNLACSPPIAHPISFPDSFLDAPARRTMRTDCLCDLVCPSHGISVVTQAMEHAAACSCGTPSVSNGKQRVHTASQRATVADADDDDDDIQSLASAFEHVSTGYVHYDSPLVVMTQAEYLDLSTRASTARSTSGFTAASSTAVPSVSAAPSSASGTGRTRASSVYSTSTTGTDFVSATSTNAGGPPRAGAPRAGGPAFGSTATGYAPFTPPPPAANAQAPAHGPVPATAPNPAPDHAAPVAGATGPQLPGTSAVEVANAARMRATGFIQPGEFTEYDPHPTVLGDGSNNGPVYMVWVGQDPTVAVGNVVATFWSW